jgi:predicted polyphosphate/ATP-dependent NAD kinase
VAARLGLIVNPVAGIGGRAGLKGSDDRALVEEARARGAEAVAPARAVLALRTLAAGAGPHELLAWGGGMGEVEAREAGLAPVVVGAPAEPTMLFAGGDGTAVDLLCAIGERVPVLGIPAGVKMHSAVFAVNPRSAGELAALFLGGRVRSFVEAEVMDVDEDALRAGLVSPRLHGAMRVPELPALVQGPKARSLASDRAAQEAIARYLVDEVLGDSLCFIGPGTTTRALMEALGLPKTVLGVDVVRAGRLVAGDADERTMLQLLGDGTAKVVVTPIGGQGFLFGRGNQQLSAPLLRRVGRESVVVAATEAKLAALRGQPLLVDTGDADVDRMFAGYVRVVTGYKREIVYQIA